MGCERRGPVLGMFVLTVTLKSVSYGEEKSVFYMVDILFLLLKRA